MTFTPDRSAARILSQIIDLPQTRKLIGIAGPPGTGKSTVAAALCTKLQEAGRTVKVMPMDGFHLDNRLLDQRKLRHRKGAPETFDADGFCALIERAASGAAVVYPVFDRTRDIAIAGAGYVAQDTEFVLVEGNYLLFDRAPWTALPQFWTFSVWVGTTKNELIDRLIERWLAEGLSKEQAFEKVHNNDLANAETIQANRLPADLEL